MQLDSYISGFVIACAWAAKEIGAHVLRELFERHGSLQYFADGRQFIKAFRNADGTKSIGAYWPLAEQVTEEYIRVEFRGIFFNGSARPVTTKEINLSFFRLDGGGITHRNPSVTVEGKYGPFQTILPRSHVQVRIATEIRFDELESTYKESIPLLNVKTTNGKAYMYKLHYALMDDHGLEWDEKRHRVIRI